MSDGEKVVQEVGRIKMPLSMTGLGRLLTCFADEFKGSYAKQDGDYLIIYVDVNEEDL
jgi:hypothetical protein